MAQQEGPFSEYLQQIKITPPVEVPKPSGLEGTGAAIANIALNFMGGLRQGRQQKYMQQAMEEQKKFDAYQNAIQRVAASDLPRIKKQELVTALQGPLFSTVAADKDAAKSKNPVARFLHGLAENAMGGTVKKAQPLPMGPVVDALMKVGDPSQSLTNLSAGLNREAGMLIQEGIDEYTKAGLPLSYEMIFSGKRGEAARKLQDRGRLLGVPSIKVLDDIGKELRPLTQAEKQQARKDEELNKYTDTSSTPAPGASGTGSPVNKSQPFSMLNKTDQNQVVQQVPVNDAVGSFMGHQGKARNPPDGQVTSNIPTTKENTAVGGQKFTPYSDEQLRSDALSAIRAGHPSAEKRGEPKQFIDPVKGDIYSGYRTEGKGGIGIFVPGKGLLIGSNIRELTQAEINKPTPDSLKKARTAAATALLAFGPEINKNFSGLLDTVEAQGDLKGFENILLTAANFARLESDKKDRAALTQERIDSRRDDKSARGLLLISSTLNNDKQIGDYNTIRNNSIGALAAIDREAAKPVDQQNYAISDLLLIRAVAKATDIKTGIRDAEYNTFADVLGRLSKIYRSADNLLSNKANKLDPASRAEYIQVLKGLNDEAAADFNKTIARYTVIGKQMGVEPRELELALPAPASIYAKADKPVYTSPGAVTPKAGGTPAKASLSNKAIPNNFGRLGATR